MRKAIVMAGGQGSRLRPLTLTRPKPLMPVANRPVLAHILDWLRTHGVTDVLLTLHYRADDIRRALGDGRALGLSLTYRVEEQPLGTAGSVKFAEDWIGDEPFLIASGDALTDLDLTALIQQHRRTGAWFTLGLKTVEDPSQYGVVELDGQGRVARFQEKPGPGRAFSQLANTGIYCVEPQVLGQIPTGTPWDWSRNVFPQLLAEARPLYGQALDGYWCDIGSLEEYRRGQRDALGGAVQVTLPGASVRPGIWIGANVRVAPGVVIEGPALIGNGCRIEKDALVLPGSVLGDHTIVRAGACVWNAVVGAECEIGPNAVVRDCVIGEETRIGSRCVVSDGAAIGRGCRLMGSTRLVGREKLDPYQIMTGAAAGHAARSGRQPLGALFLLSRVRQAGSGGPDEVMVEGTKAVRH